MQKLHYDRSMPKLILAVPDPAPVLIERLIVALRDECGALGINTSLARGCAPAQQLNSVALALCTAQAVPQLDLEHGPPALALLVGAPRVPPLADPDEQLPFADPGEQPPFVGSSEQPALVSLLSGVSAVFATDLAGVELAERSGVQVERLHCGFTQGWDRRSHFDEKDIDVIVHVPDVDGATAVAASIASELDELDVRAMLPGRTLAVAQSLDHAAEERRRRLLARTKVFLALGGDGESWWPCVEAMLAGALVIAEDSSSLQPLEVGRELLSVTPEEIPKRVREILLEHKLRHRMINRAYTTLRVEVSMRRAVLELYGAARVLPVLLSDDPDAAQPDLDPEDGVLPAQELTEDGFLPGGIQIVGSSLAYRGRAPAVSALVLAQELPLVAGPHDQAVEREDQPGQEDQPLCRTLDSLAAVDRGDMEIVILEDPSCEASALRWIESHPRIAAIALRSAVALGIDARRQATARVRQGRAFSAAPRRGRNRSPRLGATA